ncbi:MAG: heme exporter protein CcmB [Pseudomonadota bacterium]
MSPFLTLVGRDLSLAWRNGGSAGRALAFFVLSISFYPFAIGADLDRLSTVAPGLIWVSALFACFLSLDQMLHGDFEDGSLDGLAAGPLGLVSVVAAKVLAHWLGTGLPLVAVAPMLGLTLGLPNGVYDELVLSLLVGTPALSLMGVVAASLTVAMRRAGFLLALLVLPFYVPTLIFGAGVVSAAVSGTSIVAPLQFLGAVTLIFLVVAPPAAAAALRLALE